MLTTRPCTSTCVIDGMPVTVTFYPDNGVLRIADASGKCIKETRWDASWRSLLDEFRGFAERNEAQDFDAMIGGLAGVARGLRSRAGCGPSWTNCLRMRSIVLTCIPNSSEISVRLRRPP